VGFSSQISGSIDICAKAQEHVEGICTVMKLHNCFIKCRKHPLLTGPLEMPLLTFNKVCTLHQLGRWTWTPVSRDNSGLCSLGLMSCPLIKYECLLWEVINLTFVHLWFFQNCWTGTGPPWLGLLRALGAPSRQILCKCYCRVWKL
jgi:hypothetical protein